jgi:hypothetical protein
MATKQHSWISKGDQRNKGRNHKVPRI